MYKSFFALALIAAYACGSSFLLNDHQIAKTNQSLSQLSEDSGVAGQQMRQLNLIENNGYIFGWLFVAFVLSLMYANDFRAAARKILTLTNLGTAAMGIAVLCSLGCYRPFEPVKLEVIKSNEEAFLLPFTGDLKKQTATNNEEYLKANLVYVKQAQIPQQWVPKGFETFGPNGAWHDAATLIRVDKSPVTREWTADTASGTSTKNEAIWVMTSDQVEFSTGWVITARIENRDDAVKFLHNYPNGSLTSVLDSEVRGKLQGDFGIEVTDLPMDALRKLATPHIQKVSKSVTDFFKPRGISITNIGISGGFVYKDKSIIDTMVKVFNAEQQKSIAIAESEAQRERNKAVVFESTGKADAILKTKQAEADGIKLLADAKIYEVEKAKSGDPLVYVQLKQLELQRELLQKWDGKYPLYFMGTSGSGGGSPNMLLQLPSIEKK